MTGSPQAGAGTIQAEGRRLKEDTLVVTDYGMANFVITQRRYLEPFLVRPETVKSAAQQLGLKPNAMHYHVAKMVRLGLVRHDGDVVNRGRNSGLFRAVAPQVLVPFLYSPHATLQEFLREIVSSESWIHNAAFDLMRLRAAWGLKLRADEGGAVVVEIVPADSSRHEPMSVSELLRSDTPALWGSADQLALSFEDAKQLQRDLAELVAKYKSRSRGSHSTYDMRTSLTSLK